MLLLCKLVFHLLTTTRQNNTTSNLEHAQTLPARRTVRARFWRQSRIPCKSAPHHRAYDDPEPRPDNRRESGGTEEDVDTGAHDGRAEELPRGQPEQADHHRGAAGAVGGGVRGRA